MVYIFLADGFEEIEALATVDVIRRAGIDCKTVGVTGKSVTGSHGIKVESDIGITDIDFNEMSAVVLPGGMPGTINLENNKNVIDAVQYAYNKELLIAAICAAPSILGHLGLLRGKKATCYDGFEYELVGAQFIPDGVCADGNIITACGAGVAIDFGLEIVAYLTGNREKTENLSKIMKYR